MKQKRKNIFKESINNFKDVRCVVLCAMFLALAVTSELYAQQIDILKISFSFMMFGAVGYLFGPAVGFMFGAATDILCFIVNPGVGAFTPLLTLVAALAGMSYGLVLYRGSIREVREPLPLWRVLVAHTVNNMFFNLILNTASISILYGKGFFAMLPLRLAKNFALLPFEIIVMMFVIRVLEKALCRIKKEG